MIALIGRGWADVKDEHGQRRLENSEDFVRFEISQALQRNIPVLPVLLDGAPMPKPSELPEQMLTLSLFQAMPLRTESIVQDAAAITQRLKALLATQRSRGIPAWLAGAAAAAALLAGIAAGPFVFEVLRLPVPRLSGRADHTVDPALSVVAGSGKSFRDRLADGQPCSFCPELVVIPGGSFTMGSSEKEQGREQDEGPQHQVKIPHSFAMAKYSVTRAEFSGFVTDSGFKSEDGCYILAPDGSWKLEKDNSWRSPGFLQNYDRHPVVCVSWTDAKAFLLWLSQKTGMHYRLLSEAEWEYAARAGSTTRYFFGDDSKDFCRFGNGADQSSGIKDLDLTCSDGFATTSPVGSYSPNNFGLYDMLGNARQWVEDCYHPTYEGAPAEASAWTLGDCSSGRVVRGSSWATAANPLRTAARSYQYPDTRLYTMGFRVARSMEP